MKIYNRKAVFLCNLLLLFVLTSCNSNECQNNIQYQYSKSNRLAKLNLISTIKLDEREYLLAKSALVLVNDEFYYFADMKRKHIIRFNKFGKFDCVIGKVGDGPGEYHYSSHNKNVCCDSLKNIYIYDETKLKIVIYDNNNNFVKEKYYNISSINFDMSFIKYKLISLLNIKSSSIFNADFFHFVNDSLNIIRSIPINYPNRYKKFNLLNFPIIFWTNDDQFIYVLFQAEPYIYKYNYLGQLIAILGYIPKDYNIVNCDISKRAANQMEKIYYLATYSTNYQFYLFKDKYLLFSYASVKLLKNYNLDDINNKHNRINNTIILTKEGEEIEIKKNDIKQGNIAYIDSKGIAYVHVNVPDNQRIDIYEIIIDE